MTKTQLEEFAEELAEILRELIEASVPVIGRKTANVLDAKVAEAKLKANL